MKKFSEQTGFNCSVFSRIEIEYGDFQAIHGISISVPVLILPVFRELLLRYGKLLSKSLFWNERKQRADSRWQQESYFTSTSINFSTIYFQIDIIFQLNYYQWPNQVLLIIDPNKYYLSIYRKNFLQIQYDFYRHALQIRYLLWQLVIERAYTKNSGRLMAGMWLFGASWWKFIKALLLYEIVHVHVSFFFFFWQLELK